MINFVKKIFQRHNNINVDVSSFANIVGYDDIKHDLALGLASEHAIYVLLNGKPGNGKSLFLTEIENLYHKHAKYYDCTMLTKAGLRDFLFKHVNIKILLLDEISRLKPVDQGILLNLLERGSVIDGRSQKNGKEIHFKNLKVISTSNNYNKIIEPLRSRFDTLHMPAYTYEEFRFISETRLKVLIKNNTELIDAIIDDVYNVLKSTDIRDCIKAAKKVKSIEELDRHISTKIKYSKIIE